MRGCPRAESPAPRARPARLLTGDVEQARTWFATLGSPTFDSSALADVVSPTPVVEPEPSATPSPSPSESAGAGAGDPAASASPTPSPSETPAAVIGALPFTGGGAPGLAALVAGLALALGVVLYWQHQRRLAAQRGFIH